MNFIYTDLGRIAYAAALEKQTQAFEALLQAKAKGQEGSNQLFFCEHPPVLTIGKSGKDSNLLVKEALLINRGITLHHVNRGGDITYHGPGQITAYPIFDLAYWEMGLKQYVHALEDVVIRFLALYGISSGRLEGATGVWLDALTPGRTRKICAIGVQSSRYVTMHGFALNINTDLSYFSLINPCGFIDKGVTSLEKELGAPQDFERAKEQLLALMEQAFPLRANRAEG
ncbi:MAG: lipoyl(octanoyl) transferase LipB [Tannerellaceae bacterium]|jgi:lipoyl(octanoyl) transferase|nr:lipoyl(octanoyl) transferase LipB [Tannerellaceae bacterium]